jgi:hypothetical protein
MPRGVADQRRERADPGAFMSLSITKRTQTRTVLTRKDWDRACQVIVELELLINEVKPGLPPETQRMVDGRLKDLEAI